jgi:hypothetical protein
MLRAAQACTSGNAILATNSAGVIATIEKEVCKVSLSALSQDTVLRVSTCT